MTTEITRPGKGKIERRDLLKNDGGMRNAWKISVNSRNYTTSKEDSPNSGNRSKIQKEEKSQTEKRTSELT